MTEEINRDFYCSCAIEAIDRKDCVHNEIEYCDLGYCQNYRHKWPTPEQFKEEYGREYPNDGAVYVLRAVELPEGWYTEWYITSYSEAQALNDGDEIICACTPWGKPPADWRPE